MNIDVLTKIIYDPIIFDFFPSHRGLLLFLYSVKEIEKGHFRSESESSNVSIRFMYSLKARKANGTPNFILGFGKNALAFVMYLNARFSFTRA